MKFRFDPYHCRPVIVETIQRLRDRWGITRLGDVICELYRYPTFYGIDYIREGIRVIKGENIDNFGVIDLSQEFDFIDTITHARFHKTQLDYNDLVFTVRGNIGKVGIYYGEDSLANINANVIKIRIKEGVSPKYVLSYLNSPIGQLFIDATTSGSVQKTITVRDIKNIPLPIPTSDEQKSIARVLAEAINSRNTNLKEASRLLTSIDDYLLTELGITLPPELENTIASRIFTAQRGEFEQRLDPAYFSFRFSRIQNALEDMPHNRLRDVVLFSSEQWDQESGFGDEFPYLEISAINTLTGEVGNICNIPKIDAPSRARMIIRQADILVSTTRPNRGAITLIGPDIQTPLIASNGFSVIRHVVDSKISKEFLLILLRSCLCLKQFEQRSSGGNYPAITQSELGRVLLPAVDLTIQSKIVAHVRNLHTEAKRLRLQAENELEAAKRRIEAMLLGESA